MVLVNDPAEKDEDKTARAISDFPRQAYSQAKRLASTQTYRHHGRETIIQTEK